MNKYEIVSIEQREVEVDLSLLTKNDSLYFNATNIANQFGKKVLEYLSNQKTDEYIKSLEKFLKVGKVTFKNDLELVKIKK
jgi:hypothetical protein